MLFPGSAVASMHTTNPVKSEWTVSNKKIFKLHCTNWMTLQRRVFFLFLHFVAHTSVVPSRDNQVILEMKGRALYFTVYGTHSDADKATCQLPFRFCELKFCMEKVHTFDTACPFFPQQLQLIFAWDKDYGHGQWTSAWFLTNTQLSTSIGFFSPQISTNCATHARTQQLNVNKNKLDYFIEMNSVISSRQHLRRVKCV